ncbi:hypothetical protein [Marinobacterium litorale]|uniref:hypothetical protein n=1 Tax=Marinobacterium litorale TaxID=404770 RepID=UPI0012EB7DCD|nr:hypothetical protein [Marinobacterium litorale]
MVAKNPDDGYEPLWHQGNENPIGLYSMETRHIQNALNRYYGRGYPKNSWQHHYADFWIKEFIEELQAREGEMQRDPVTNEWLHYKDIIEHRKASRLILGLPPMKPSRKLKSTSEYTPPKVSLFS